MQITPKESLAGAFQDYLSFRNPYSSCPTFLPIPIYPNCFPSLWSKSRSLIDKSHERSYGNPKKMELEKVPAVSIGFSVTPLLDIVVLANGIWAPACRQWSEMNGALSTSSLPQFKFFKSVSL